MGSSGSGSALDCGVGSIVWVRRRNGSWWPGRILGPGDLSTSNLTSPRSGTPVKLLGREDASIDWYNLEKSKRVKAFRCGEFDDCIRKAEASQGLPPKKREKYARREDAILHALELERQLLRKQGKLPDLISNISSGTVKKASGPLSDKLENDDGIFRVSKASKAVRSCQPSHKGDLETAPRMKGLRDFGLRVAPQKRKFSSIASDDTCKVNNNSQALPYDVSFGNTRGINGMELMETAFRANRSTKSMEDGNEIPLNLVKKAHPHFQEDEHPHPGSTAEINPSRLLEESESDSSDTESDSTETEPDIDWGMSVQSDISLPLKSDRRPGAPGLDESLSSEDYDGSPLSGEMTNIYSHDHVSASGTVSKWQLKGKRNIRSLTKRHVDAAGGRSSLNMFTGSARKNLAQSSGYYRKEDFIDDDDDDMDFYPEDTRMEWSDVENREYMFTPRSVSNYRNSFGRDLIDLELGLEDRAVIKGNWEDRWEQFNPMYASHHYYGGRMRPMLIDVDLEVKGAGYQKESVPLISMTSKVSGQPIVGHPIQIEVLEDGSSENLISNNVGFAYNIIDHKGIATLPPAWKTARRTANSRVPRPHVSSTLDGYRYTEELSPSDQEMEKPVERSSPMKKRRTDVPQVVNSRTYTGKTPKKVSVSSGQRTRTLSSIAGDQKFSSKHVHGCSNSQIDGVRKPQSPGPNSVASIPCKLVFSRLLEKINRPQPKANNSAALERLPL